MNKILCIIAGLVIFCAFNADAKSSSDLLGGSTTKSKNTVGVTGKSSGSKSGVGLTNSATGSKTQSKTQKAKTNSPGSSKKGPVDPLTGKSGSKTR